MKVSAEQLKDMIDRLPDSNLSGSLNEYHFNVLDESTFAKFTKDETNSDGTVNTKEFRWKKEPHPYKLKWEYYLDL